MPSDAASTTVADRVRHIVGLMARNEWTGKRAQARELAAEWGITASTVRNYTAEAHRVLMCDPKQRTAWRNQLAAKMARIADKAERMRNAVTGLPDFASAIRANEKLAEFTGALDTSGTENGAAPHVEVVVLPKEPKPCTTT